MGKFGVDIIIHYLPKTINAIGRKHWAVKQQERFQIQCLVHDALVGRKPARAIKRAKLTLTRHSSSPCDPDNLAVSFKGVLDALVEEGVLEDDRMKNIGFPDYRWEQAKRGMGKITVSIEELDCE